MDENNTEEQSHNEYSEEITIALNNIKKFSDWGKQMITIISTMISVLMIIINLPFIFLKESLDFSTAYSITYLVCVIITLLVGFATIFYFIVIILPVQEKTFENDEKKYEYYKNQEKMIIGHAKDSTKPLAVMYLLSIADIILLLVGILFLI